MQKDQVFIGIPLGAAGVYSAGTHMAILQSIPTKRQLYPHHNAMSLLPLAFNSLWCAALNLRKEHGINRFVMLHSDIQPLDAKWIDVLLDELDKTGADVLSVVNAIKDHNGLSSTAVDTNPWRPKRLTFTEIGKLPDTFCADDVECYSRNTHGTCGLLVNTGLMAVKFDSPWVEKVCFDFRSRVIQTDNNTFTAEIEPEDWRFSRWCNRQCLTVLATTKVPTKHIGQVGFGNQDVWGQMEVDEINRDFYES